MNDNSSSVEDLTTNNKTVVTPVKQVGSVFFYMTVVTVVSLTLGFAGGFTVATGIHKVSDVEISSVTSN